MDNVPVSSAFTWPPPLEMNYKSNYQKLSAAGTPPLSAAYIQCGLEALGHPIRRSAMSPGPRGKTSGQKSERMKSRMNSRSQGAASKMPQTLQVSRLEKHKG